MKTPKTFLLFTLLLSACTFPWPRPVAHAGPRAWIDAPLDGSRLPFGPVEVVSHGADPGGVRQVELRMNGSVIYTADEPGPRQTLVAVRRVWIPPGPGNYTLQVRAQSRAGAWSEFATSVVTIGGRVPPSDAAPTGTPARLDVPSPTGTLTPTGTPAQPDVPSPTGTPAPTGTPTLPPRPATTWTLPPPTNTPTLPPRPTATRALPPTATNTPAPSIQFGADATIVQGQCASLTWSTANVSAVYLDGTGVAGNGSTQVCPPVTTTYTLSVLLGDGSTVTRQVTITVISPSPTTPPADTAGPSLGRVVASGTVFYRSRACGPETITITALVTDPSGVADVTLWYGLQPSRAYSSAAMDFVGSDSYAKTLNGPDFPGSDSATLEFYVTATDRWGNASQSPTDTSVTLIACGR